MTTTRTRSDATKLATIVIAESQAPCEVPFAHLRGLTFLRQQADEGMDALGARVSRLVARMRAEDLVVERAWFLMSAHHDEQSFVTRRGIAQALADAVRRGHGRGLTIVAPDELPAHTRAAAISLAGSVVEASGNEGEASRQATVHVRFVRPRRAAGAVRGRRALDAVGSQMAARGRPFALAM